MRGGFVRRVWCMPRPAGDTATATVPTARTFNPAITCKPHDQQVQCMQARGPAQGRHFALSGLKEGAGAAARTMQPAPEREHRTHLRQQLQQHRRPRRAAKPAPPAIQHGSCAVGYRGCRCCGRPPQRSEQLVGVCLIMGFGAQQRQRQPAEQVGALAQCRGQLMHLWVCACGVCGQNAHV